MTSRLVAFGDSWPAGSELPQHEMGQRFPELVAHNLGMTCANLAQPSTSIDHAVREFLNILPALKHSAVLFCLTAKERGLYFENGAVKELHSQHRDPASLNYYSHVYSEELGEYQRTKNVLLVQELCARHRVPCFFVCNWNDTPKHEAINTVLFHPLSLVEILGIPNFENSDLFYTLRETSPYIVPNQGHPNLAGHQLIAQTLTTWIQPQLN